VIGIVLILFIIFIPQGILGLFLGWIRREGN
jgi:hypothetical protein